MRNVEGDVQHVPLVPFQLLAAEKFGYVPITKLDEERLNAYMPDYDPGLTYDEMLAALKETYDDAKASGVPGYGILTMIRGQVAGWIDERLTEPRSALCAFSDFLLLHVPKGAFAI